jgi:hypothetical protein
MWPRNEASSSSPTRSVGDVRGFTNWPAIRPTFTTGSVAPNVSTAAIWSMIFSFSRIAIAEKTSKDSTQSPAWRRKARPAATSASASRSARASPANTSGGIAASRARTASTRSGFGQSGCCNAS